MEHEISGSLSRERNVYSRRSFWLKIRNYLAAESNMLPTEPTECEWDNLHYDEGQNDFHQNHHISNFIFTIGFAKTPTLQFFLLMLTLNGCGRFLFVIKIARCSYVSTEDKSFLEKRRGCWFAWYKRSCRSYQNSWTNSDCCWFQKMVYRAVGKITPAHGASCQVPVTVIKWHLVKIMAAINHSGAHFQNCALEFRLAHITISTRDKMHDSNYVRTKKYIFKLVRGPWVNIRLACRDCKFNFQIQREEHIKGFFLFPMKFETTPMHS